MFEIDTSAYLVLKPSGGTRKKTANYQKSKLSKQRKTFVTANQVITSEWTFKAELNSDVNLYSD